MFKLSFDNFDRNTLHMCLRNIIILINSSSLCYEEICYPFPRASSIGNLYLLDPNGNATSVVEKTKHLTR